MFAYASALPRHLPPPQCSAPYVERYLKEEITAEAHLSRESAVKRSTVERYFQILEDTLLAFRVPADRARLSS